MANVTIGGMEPVLINYAQYNPDCIYAPCARPIKFIRSSLLANGDMAVATLCQIHFDHEQQQLRDADLVRLEAEKNPKEN